MPYNAIPQLDTIIYIKLNVFIPQQIFQTHSFEHVTHFILAPTLIFQEFAGYVLESNLKRQKFQGGFFFYFFKKRIIIIMFYLN
jgi:hypothetical protein